MPLRALLVSSYALPNHVLYLPPNLRFLTSPSRWVLFSNRRGIIVLVIACATLVSLFRADSPHPLRQTYRLSLLPKRPYFPEATPGVCPPDHNCPLSSPDPDPDENVVTYDDTPVQKQKVSNPNLSSGTTPIVILDKTQLQNALFPIFDPHLTDGNAWIDENNRQLKALFRCVELSNCGPNQAKGAVRYSIFTSLGSYHCSNTNSSSKS
jgi:hypothetical protein